MSVIGVGAGLVVGYIPGGIAGVLVGILVSSGMLPSDSGGYAEATLISSLVWLACAGAITALIQTRMSHDRGLLPKGWVIASATGWALIALLRIGPAVWTSAQSSWAGFCSALSARYCSSCSPPVPPWASD